MTDSSRREFLKSSLLATAAVATGALPLTARSMATRGDAPRVLVVGAGVFGGWTALHLLRQGASVTLVDAWGAGNPRASSGGETRVIRGMYGPDAVYVDWVLRSFELWQQAEKEWGHPLYTPTGALWMFRGDDDYARSSIPLLTERDLPVEKLTPDAAQQRFPNIRLDGVDSIYYEKKAGYLVARQACRHLQQAFVSSGGDYRVARAKPTGFNNGHLESVALSDGSTVKADAYIFACGPWLGEMFPDVLGKTLRPTRQEVYYFGTPPGDTGYREDRFPVWVDFGERIFYGIPDNRGRGFKIADDTRGEPVDPTTMQRTPSMAGVQRARKLLVERFPDLENAPLIEARVCQYTNSPDGHFVLDRHPEVDNLWLAGGGSGHGFKLGPAVGEHVSKLVLGEAEPVDIFSIGRLNQTGEERSQLSSSKEEAH